MAVSMIRFPSSQKGATTSSSLPKSNSSSNSNTQQQQQSEAPSTPSSFWPRKPRKTSDGSQATASTVDGASPLRARSDSAKEYHSSHSYYTQQQHLDDSLDMPDFSSAAPQHPPPQPRRRLNSRDIPRTYSGLYGNTDDLLPFELSRQHGSRSGLFFGNVWILLGVYGTFLAIVFLLCMLVVPTDAIVDWSWTLTNTVHCLVTLLYLHWFKGSLTDDSGEMEALTLWEQLDSSQDTRAARETLMVVPCLLAWVACHAADYEPRVCVWNTILWVVSMLGKLPFMNGVRLFGINRTAGIDDLDSVQSGMSTTAAVATTTTLSSSSAMTATTMEHEKRKNR